MKCNILGAMRRTPYLTDLSDAEWNCIAPLLPVPCVHGRPRLHSPREIINAILYMLRSGCAWRLLPHDLPPWKTVYHYFRLWRSNGSGNGSIQHFVSKCVRKWGAKLNQVLGSSTPMCTSCQGQKTSPFLPFNQA